MGRSVPFPSPPVAGEIMWLPRHDPTYTVDEKKLNHPVLVLYSLPGGTCWFLIVTSFGGRTIDLRFPGQSEYCKKKREKYIPIYPGEPHPDTMECFYPIVTGNPNIYNNGRTSYIDLEDSISADYYIFENLSRGTMRLRDHDLRRVRELAKSYAPAGIRQQLEQAEMKHKTGTKFVTSYGEHMSPATPQRRETKYSYLDSLTPSKSSQIPEGHIQQDPWNIINKPSYSSPSTTYRPLTSGRTYESSLYGSYGSALYENYDHSSDGDFKPHSWHGNNIRQQKSLRAVARREPKSTPLWVTLICLPFTIIKFAFDLYVAIIQGMFLLAVIVAFLFMVLNVMLG